MDSDANSDAICVFRGANTETYIMPIKLFQGNEFISWRMNRPMDKLRVQEISEYLIQSNPEKIDGEILAAKIISEWAVGKQHYEVYDGNHRREAILSGYVNINPDAKVLVTIVTVQDDLELLSHFHRINKMVPLSDVHLQSDQGVTKMLYEIAEEYRTKFPTLCKGSDRVVRPNFNRDTFVESMYRIMIDSDGKIKNKYQMTFYLDLYNEYIRDNFSRLLNEAYKNYTVKGLNITRPMYLTADKIGCYIFLGKNLALDVSEIVVSSA